MKHRFALLCLATLSAGCPGPMPPDAGTPFFPGDYAATWREVRGCRRSGDHDLNHVRIFADPSSADIYLSRDGGFRPGMVIIKAEYDFADDLCSGPIKQLTVMRKGADGGSPATLDWQWQTVSGARAVVSENGARCISCHRACGVPPDGFEGTCALP